jgi:gamma-butyrobetaine dioxygenase
VSAVDELAVLMAGRGRRNYGENISLAEHSLLTAVAAEEHGGSDTLVAACLLHDVGHFLDEPDDAYGIHSHADLGGDWVACRFGPAIAEPVRLHVDAKRYLCARTPEYHDHLSAASQYTLTRQGGPMTPDEVAGFEARPYAQDAVRLRRLEDDHGKLARAETPPLDHFGPLLDRLESTTAEPSASGSGGFRS